MSVISKPQSACIHSKGAAANATVLESPPSSRLEDGDSILKRKGRVCCTGPAFWPCITDFAALNLHPVQLHAMYWALQIMESFVLLASAFSIPFFILSLSCIYYASCPKFSLPQAAMNSWL